MCRRLASAHADNFAEGLTIVAGLEILIRSADTGNQFLDKARVLRHIAYSANRLWGGIFKKDPGLGTDCGNRHFCGSFQVVVAQHCGV